MDKGGAVPGRSDFNESVFFDLKEDEKDDGEGCEVPGGEPHLPTCVRDGPPDLLDCTLGPGTGFSSDQPPATPEATQSGAGGEAADGALHAEAAGEEEEAAAEVPAPAPSPPASSLLEVEQEGGTLLPPLPPHVPDLPREDPGALEVPERGEHGEGGGQPACPPMEPDEEKTQEGSHAAEEGPLTPTVHNDGALLQSPCGPLLPHVRKEAATDPPPSTTFSGEGPEEASQSHLDDLSANAPPPQPHALEEEAPPADARPPPTVPTVGMEVDEESAPTAGMEVESAAADEPAAASPHEEESLEEEGEEPPQPMTLEEGSSQEATSSSSHSQEEGALDLAGVMNRVSKSLHRHGHPRRYVLLWAVLPSIVPSHPKGFSPLTSSFSSSSWLSSDEDDESSEQGGGVDQRGRAEDSLSGDETQSEGEDTWTMLRHR